MTAIEKLLCSMNKFSPFWTKNLEVTVQQGEIIIVKCEGFCFKSDESGKFPGNFPGQGAGYETEKKKE